MFRSSLHLPYYVHVGIVHPAAIGMKKRSRYPYNCTPCMVLIRQPLLLSAHLLLLFVVGYRRTCWGGRSDIHVHR